MLRVLDIILNKFYHKLGFQNGKGKTYEALLTTSSIPLAQKYYELLTRVKNGETSLKVVRDADSLVPIEVKANDGATISLNNLVCQNKYEDIAYGIKLGNRNIGFNGKFYFLSDNPNI